MVDDITLLPSIIKPGTRYENNELVVKDDAVSEDMDIPGDIRTMKIIQKVANDIDGNIKVTFDVPSYHDDGYVPILDVKVKINVENKIEYKFYKKTISKQPWHFKKLCIFNEKQDDNFNPRVFLQIAQYK